MSENTENPTQEVTINNTPPVKFERDENGLLKHIQYVFGEDGYVDWRKMVPNKFLYVNPQNKERIQKKHGKKYEEINIEKDKIDDIDLVIMLGGLKLLAKLRGLVFVKYDVSSANEFYAGVTCNITFIPNFETEGNDLIFSDSGCAHVHNTTGFGQKYLLEIATNRAFCRTVRNALGINIVSKEELDGNFNQDKNGEPSSSLDPHTMISSLMEKKKINLEKVIAWIKKNNKMEDPESIQSIKDVPISLLNEISEILNKKKTKEEANS